MVVLTSFAYNGVKYMYKGGTEELSWQLRFIPYLELIFLKFYFKIYAMSILFLCTFRLDTNINQDKLKVNELCTKSIINSVVLNS